MVLSITQQLNLVSRTVLFILKFFVTDNILGKFGEEKLAFFEFNDELLTTGIIFNISGFASKWWL